MINHLHLRAFHAVAMERSFTRAAQVLNVSQSTLSWQVKALEEAYAVRLLDRRGRTVVTTAIGEETLALTREMFRVQDALEAFLDKTQKLQAGHLRLGADGPRHIIPVLDDFRRLHPGMTVSLTTGNARKVLDDLLTSEVDVAIVASPKRRVTELYMKPFCIYPLLAIVSREHPWAKRKSVRITDFSGESLIIREPASMVRQMIFRAMQDKGAAPARTIEIDSREAGREAAARGMGIVVMGESEFRSINDERCVGLPIRDPSLSITEYVTCLAKRRMTRSIKEFFLVAHRYAQPALFPMWATGTAKR